MNSTKSSPALTLASILPMENLQAEVARRLMNMTISDLVKLTAGGAAPAPVAPKKTRKKAKQTVPAKKKVKPVKKAKQTVPAKKKVKPVKKARRSYRKLGPMSERIERLIAGASISEWRSMRDMVAISGEEMPNTDHRTCMVKGYTKMGVKHAPVLEWNGVSGFGARYRMIPSVGIEADPDLI